MIQKVNLGKEVLVVFDIQDIEWWTEQLNGSLAEASMLYFRVIYKGKKLFVSRKQVTIAICTCIVENRRFFNMAGYWPHGK